MVIETFKGYSIAEETEALLRLPMQALFRQSKILHIKDNKLQKQLDNTKSTPSNSIPTKLFKENIDHYSDIITKMYNKSVHTSTFPDKLKSAEVIPVHKKNETTDQTNYRPVSLLPTLSKIYERIMYKQMSEYINKYLSDYLCGFRKGISSQHSLIIMIEKIRKILDKGGYAGVLLTDLSKAFDCIVHDLLIAKLNAYGFGYEALTFIYNYLSDRKQSVRVNTTCSSWKDILYGVPQGSILGVLLFNININDFFLFCEHSNITNYADDTKTYAFNNDVNLMIEQLENYLGILSEWFKNNYMKLNSDKCKLLTNNEKDSVSIKMCIMT